MSAEASSTVDEEVENEEFSLDECAFPTAKQPESYNDVSICETLTSEKHSDIETLIEQYPDVCHELTKSHRPN